MDGVSGLELLGGTGSVVGEIANGLSSVSAGIGDDCEDEFADFLDFVLAPGRDQIARKGLRGEQGGARDTEFGVAMREFATVERLNREGHDEMVGGERGTLGNLTCTAFNSEMGNCSFSEKRDAERGFRNSPLRLNADLRQTERWDGDARDDRQLRHIDHAWSSTVHAAQGMTRDAAIGVLDTGHGRLTGQAALYVEASRARDRFVLVTDNRELLEEVLEENDSVRVTALEAVGDDDPSLGAAIRMLRELRDDWRALVARAEAENAGLSRMDDYARIVTGVEQLDDGLDLPADLAAFAAEVRSRDAEIVERRRRELAFVQKADMHCRKQPLLKWAAEERGRPLSELPEHAEWLADGAALAETGRRMGEGLVGRIAAALKSIVRSFRLDEAERFREAAVRHEAEAQAIGIDPRGMAGAEELAERARALGDRELPGDTQP